MVDVVDARREQGGAHFDGREHSVESGRVQEDVRGLRDISGVKWVVERIVADVVLFQRDGEREESACRDLQRRQQFPGGEGGVCDGGQRTAAGQVADAENVNAPAVEISE